jgi:hypothetical protein
MNSSESPMWKNQCPNPHTPNPDVRVTCTPPGEWIRMVPQGHLHIYRDHIVWKERGHPEVPFHRGEWKARTTPPAPASLRFSIGSLLSKSDSRVHQEMRVPASSPRHACFPTGRGSRIVDMGMWWLTKRSARHGKEKRRKSSARQIVRPEYLHADRRNDRYISPSQRSCRGFHHCRAGVRARRGSNLGQNHVPFREHYPILRSARPLRANRLG